MVDIVGFSRLMRQDDEGTTERVVRFHAEVETLAASHGGRVVDTAGDSVFAVFESIVLALECAVALQQWLAKDERKDRLMVRAGLHFGDVLIHEDRLFGDGVNIAARLQQLAPPGGIAVSEVVHQEVGGRISFREAGIHTLKNISRPIRVFVVPPEHLGFPPAPVTPGEDAAEAAAPEGAAAVREIAGLVRERVAAKRARHASTDRLDDEIEEIAERAERQRRSAVTVGGVLSSGGFWFSSAAGALLIASYASGWTTNGLYPLLGALLVALEAGSLLRAATRRRGMQPLMVAIALALSAWWFLDGTVSRAVVWVLAAAALGPAIAGMRRST